MKWKSLIAVFFIAIIVGQRLPQREYQYAISWDTFGYYLYLPALLYHHDLELSDPLWANDMRIKYDLSGTLYQIHPLDNGNHVIQYTSGMAFMMAPAFVAGHYSAKWLGYPMDGYALPYQICVWIWSFMVAFIGLLYLRKLLLMFFADQRVMWILLMIAFATNYYIHTTQDIATSHIYLFTLYCIYVCHLIQWHGQKKWKDLVALSFSFGLMCLARPTEIIAIVLFLLWGFRGVQAHCIYWWNTIRTHKAQFLAWILIVGTCALPQILYWMHVSGKPFVMSYANPGEGFDFAQPHTFDYLFSFRKGLFIYTPVLFLSLFSFLYLWKNRRADFWTFSVFIILYIYVVSSWSCWWYAHCFGQRSIYQVLPVFAILLGHFMQWISLRSWTALAGKTLLALCFLLCVFQSYQYATHVIHGSRMTKAYYLATFGKLHIPPHAEELLLVERPTTENWPFVHRDRYSSRIIYDFRNEELHKVAMRPDGPGFEEDVQMFSPEKPFSEGWETTWGQLTSKDHNWLHVEATFFAPTDFKPDDLCLVVTMNHNDGNYGYVARSIHPDSLKAGDWNTIAFDYLTPEVRVSSDKISSYLWFRGQGKAYLRQLVITQYEPLH